LDCLGCYWPYLAPTFYETNTRAPGPTDKHYHFCCLYSIIPIGRQVDHAAHFGGLVAGYAFGWIAYMGNKVSKTKLLVAAAALAHYGCIYKSTCIWLAPVYELKELQPVE
jgi:hypothetical protein